MGIVKVKVEIVKDFGIFKKGEVHEYWHKHATTLIQRGIAKVWSEKKKQPKVEE